jgi:DNA-binding Xre family transcriptional regulator
MRKSTRDISPVYTILVEALNAYYDRIKLQRATTERTRAEDLGISSAILSRIKRGRYKLSARMTRQIVMRICASEEEWRALERRLFQPTSTAPGDTAHPPLISFVRKWGKPDAALVIEHTGRWPFVWGLESHYAPMTTTFREAMNAGMNVIIFLPYEVHETSFVTSMGDRFAETYAGRTFDSLRRISRDERVGFYCLRENQCPTPDIGIRITGLRPDERPESVWLIPHGPHEDLHFVPTSERPKDVIQLILGFALDHLRDGNGPPTQEDIDRRWAAEYRDRNIRGASRPCPIHRIE